MIGLVEFSGQEVSDRYVGQPFGMRRFISALLSGEPAVGIVLLVSRAGDTIPVLATTPENDDLLEDGLVALLKLVRLRSPLVVEGLLSKFKSDSERLGSMRLFGIDDEHPVV